MMRGFAGAVSAPSTAFVAPPTIRVAPVAELVGQAAAPAATGTSAPQHGASIAAAVVFGAGATVAGRRRRQRAGEGSSRTVATRAFEDELGVQPPFGFWDPMGFCKDGDVEDFKRRRETELKHGRVCMFATIGYMVPEYYKIPGYLAPSANLKFADVPNGLKAIEKVPTEGWLQIIALAGFYELVVNQPQNPDEPGNYGRGWLGFGAGGVEDPEKRKRSLNAELANGRLAMMAIIGMFYQDGLTGSAWGDWANYTASPLRAFENELGVQSPFGFWDPAGFTSDGDVEAFKRRRVTEIKHGRVSMLATLGYMVPEGYRFEGYLSPSEGIQFSDVPHGLAAISKVPAAGWAQILAFAGYIELVYFKADPTRAPGDYANAGVLGFPDGSTISDPEEKKRRLNAEIANGRLAMTAILALFFQNGTVGTTGPEMWLGSR